MIVVADPSPLVVLVEIDMVELLPRLFEKCVTPPAVIAELGSARRSALVRAFAANLPEWMSERESLDRSPIHGLHSGELMALHLAEELGGMLLIDERRGRRAARVRGVPIIGCVGVLEIAAEQGWIDLADAFARIKRLNGYWMSPEFLDERLRRHRAPGQHE